MMKVTISTIAKTVYRRPKYEGVIFTKLFMFQIWLELNLGLFRGLTEGETVSLHEVLKLIERVD
jgi:hypothetical protein